MLLGMTAGRVQEMKRSGALAVAATLLLSSCATVGQAPAPMQDQPRPIVASLPKDAPKVVAPPTAADQEHDRLVSSYGGVYRNPVTEAYLDDLVQRLTAQSDRPDIPYRLTILNASSVNAFALPSGRLYVTRGLLALANDDAEIAAVIAHEMAHVSTRHAMARADMEKQGVLVSNVMSQLLHNPAGTEAVQKRSKVTLATFSRQQELEADQIGVRTIGRAGFDPYGASRFLASMSRQLNFRGATRGPATGASAYDFLNTHPSTPERIQRAVEVAREFASAGTTGERDRIGYLTAIDGLTYGDDPSQGFVSGRSFVHPRLGFTFVAPPNFSIDNTPQAILGLDGGGRALRLDTVKLKAGQTLDTYLTSGWIDGVDPASVARLKLDGNDAVTAVARGDEWSFRLYAIRFGDDVYRLVLAARDLDAATDAVFREAASSFRRLSAEEIRNVRPMRIDVATVRSGDTLQSLSTRMATPEDKLSRFLVLNGLDPNVSPAPGERVKIVIE